MVERVEAFTRGGIYLAKLYPVKLGEIGKVRPVVILNSQAILDVIPPVVLICPISSKSHAQFDSLHFELSIRDNLHVKSYAIIEQCRAIAVSRIIGTRVGAVTDYEMTGILRKLQILVGM